MRRILIGITLLILLVLLCACSPALPGPEQPLADSQPAEDKPLADNQPAEDKPLTDSQPAEDTPKILSPLAPTPTIVPLVNARRIYSHCIIGPVTFIYAADQSPVQLPDSVYNYAPVRAEEDGALLAYALFSKDEWAGGLMAFMDVRGQMLTDFIYESFGEDYVYFPNRNGYLTIMREGRYGLLNLADGQEVIPPEYDLLRPGKQVIAAEKNGIGWLLDYQGQPWQNPVGSLGNLFMEEDERWVEENLERIGANLYRRIRLEPAYSMQLEDGAGNIIVEFSRYDYLYPYGNFIIGRSSESRNPDFDILNSLGEVLLHNPYGAIGYEGGFAEFMVVWLDANTCIFLHTDGSSEPISAPPEVERIYLGG